MCPLFFAPNEAVRKKKTSNSIGPQATFLVVPSIPSCHSRSWKFLQDFFGKMNDACGEYCSFA